MSAPGHDEFERAMQRIETLIDALEQQPQSQPVEQARELLLAVLQVHGIGLHALWSELRAHTGEGLLTKLAHDARIATLLSLHGLQTGPGDPALIPAANLVRSPSGGVA